jgi:hypothetical protein
LSFIADDRFELAKNRVVLTANLLDQVGDCFEVSASSGVLGAGQRRRENSRVNCSRARFERMRGGLDCVGITALHCLLEGREAGGRIFRERCKQGAEHLFDTGFAELRAKALDIYVR